MQILINVIENILALANAMSLYILGGLFAAGILKQLIPDNFISSHLGENKSGSVVKATLLGIPIPVCSCSVIPLAKSLQKEGASKGAIQSFLISTPITGVDSILATYSFFGWFFTLYRIITSVIIALTTGFIQNFVDNKELKTEELESEGCHSCCCSCGTNPPKKGFSIKESLHYAYNTLFIDIYKPLTFGLIIGGIFTTFIPKEMLQPLFDNQWLTYIAVLFIAMPLYVCATASLPIAAAFILTGMSPGAAFVFLSAGPATNTVTMGVVLEMFGKRSLFIYLGTISLLSILFGYCWDSFFGDVDVLQISGHFETFGILESIGTAVMLSLSGYYFIKGNKK